MAGDAFSRIEIAHLEGRAKSTRGRQNLLHSLNNTLRSSEKTIKNAILADTGYTDSEITLEYTLAIAELSTHYHSVSLDEDLKNQRALDDPNSTTNVGIVYIAPSKQNLFYSVISSLTAALAAGNCVILEVCELGSWTDPSSLTPIS